MVDNAILLREEGYAEEIVEAQDESKRLFQISKSSSGSKRQMDSRGSMDFNNQALCDLTEGDKKTPTVEQRPPLRQDASKDSVVVDEDSDSDGFEIKNVKPPLEDRRLNAKRRAKQAILFTSLVEDRLAFLEEQFQRLQQLTGEDPIVLRNFKDSVNSSAPAHAAEIKHMVWAEWKVTPAIINAKGPKAKHNTEVNAAPRSVLEVLIEDPQANMRRRLRMREKIQDLSTKRSEQNENVKTLLPVGSDPGPLGAPRVPERLRIRSSALLEILDELADIKLPTGPSGLNVLVILRPYKLLFTYEKKIRDRLAAMEEENENRSMDDEALISAGKRERKPVFQSAKSSQNRYLHLNRRISSDNKPGVLSPGSLNDESGSYNLGLLPDTLNTRKGLEHLRLLVEFMDKDLKPLFDLRKRIQEGSARKIAFADLWHLYEHGLVVRAPGSELQLYRVLKVS